MQHIPKNQPKVSAMMAKRSGNHPIKDNLSSREFCCVIWACKGLAYDLVDDGLFRAQFAPCLPVGFGRKELSQEMKLLGQKAMDLIFTKIGKGVVSLAVDGWTNCRHKKVINILSIHRGQAFFLETVEVAANTAEILFQALQKTKKMVEEKGVVVCSVVGDNATAVQAALTKFVCNPLIRYGNAFFSAQSGG